MSTTPEPIPPPWFIAFVRELEARAPAALRETLDKRDADLVANLRALSTALSARDEMRKQIETLLLEFRTQRDEIASLRARIDELAREHAAP